MTEGFDARAFAASLTRTKWETLPYEELVIVDRSLRVTREALGTLIKARRAELKAQSKEDRKAAEQARSDERAEKIRAKRQQMGWSTTDLALIAGVDQGTVMNMEKGRAVRFDSIAAVAKALGMRLDDLA